LRLPTRKGYHANNHAIETFKERDAGICKVCGERLAALSASRAMQ
jgi:hypothetical protein